MTLPIRPTSVFLLLLLIPLLLHAEPPARNDFLPISVWYSGGKARAPMLSEIGPRSEEEWRKDLNQIRSLGFNTVRTWVEWTACEPRPGEYRFENLNLLCRLARQAGLRVIIQLYVDSAPDWVGKQFPDGLYEAQSGDKVASQSAPGFCTDHPGVREAVLRFITETARTANRHDNFFGWDLWSEPHIVNWAYINYVPNVQFCYCPSSRARFRDWLKIKYSGLPQVNRAWYRNFSSWEEVDPPRFGTILSYTDFIDWKNFIYEKMAADLRMRYAAVRKADRDHVITSHAAVPSIFYTPYNGYGATDDFLMAEQVDYYGTSLYPKHNHPRSHWEAWRFMTAVDFSRSANRANGGFYVGELQAGHGTIGLDIGNPITPEDHRLWIWSAIAKGARGINLYAYYPMSSGYESGGYGLIHLDGSLTERAVEAGKIAGLIDRKQALFLQSAPARAQVAIVYNPLAQMVGGEQRGNTADMHQQSLIGCYRAFAEQNVPVDFIHRRDLERGAPLPYRLVLLPYPLMLSMKAAQGIRDFVHRGGHVLAEARLAWNDERGYAAEAIPGMGLHSVFGAREDRIRMAEKPRLQISAGADHPALAGWKAGEALTGAYWSESLQPGTAPGTAVLGTWEDGTPALVAGRFGQGETLLVGTFLGLAGHPVPQENNNRFLLNLLNWAGVERPFRRISAGGPSAGTEIRLLENPQGFVLFLIGHSSRQEQVDLRIRVSQDGLFRMEQLTAESRPVAVTSRNKEIPFSSVLKGNDIQVWEIRSTPSAP